MTNPDGSTTTTTTDTVEIPVKNVTPGTVVVIVDKNVNETVVPTTGLTKNGVTVTLSESAAIKIAENSTAFSDVKAKDYFSDAVDSASARGITGGYGNGLFGTNDTITREQVATMLYRLPGE